MKEDFFLLLMISKHWTGTFFPGSRGSRLTYCRLDIIDRKLRTFTQLKRNKRFDNFIMLVWVQGSPFHIAAGSHPVQEAWGSQDSLYRGQIQKLLQCCREPYQQIPLVITIQKKYSLTYLRRTVS